MNASPDLPHNQGEVPKRPEQLSGHDRVIKALKDGMGLFEQIPEDQQSPAQRAQLEVIKKRLADVDNGGDGTEKVELKNKKGKIIKVQQEGIPVDELLIFLEAKHKDALAGKDSKLAKQLRVILRSLTRKKVTENYLDPSRRWIPGHYQARVEEEMKRMRIDGRSTGDVRADEKIANDALAKRRELFIPQPEPAPTPPPAPPAEPGLTPGPESKPAPPATEDPRFTISFVNTDDDAKKIAREISGEYVREQLHVKNRWSPREWFRAIRFRLGEEYYKYTKTQEVQRAQINAGQYFAEVDAVSGAVRQINQGRVRYEAQTSAIAQRFSLENETKGSVSRKEAATITTLGSEQIKTQINTLISRFARGEIDQNQFMQDRQTVIAALKTDPNTSPLIKESNFVGTDLLEVALKVKESYQRGKLGLEHLDRVLKIQLGRAVEAANTEADYSRLERTINWLQGGRFRGVLANPLMIGVLFGLGGVGARAALGWSARAATAFPLAGVFFGALFSGLRRFTDLKRDRELAERNFAYSQDATGPRGERLAEYSYNRDTQGRRTSIESLSSELAALSTDLSTESRRRDALQKIAEIDARINYGIENKIDLFSYGDERYNTAIQRLNLVLERNKTLLDIRRVLKDEGRNEQEIDDAINQTLTTETAALQTGFGATRQEQDRRFNRYRLGQALAAGTVGGILGLAGGLITQEGIALVRRGVGAVAGNTILENLLAGRNIIEESPITTNDLTRHTVRELFARPGNATVDTNLIFRTGVDHAASFTDGSGRLIETPPMHITADGHIIASGIPDNLPPQIRHLVDSWTNLPYNNPDFNVQAHVQEVLTANRHETITNGDVIIDIGSNPNNPNQMSMLHYPTGTQIHGFAKMENGQAVFDIDQAFNGNKNLTPKDWTNFQSVLNKDGWGVGHETITEQVVPVKTPSNPQEYLTQKGEWGPTQRDLWHDNETPMQRVNGRWIGADGKELQFYHRLDNGKIVIDFSHMESSLKEGKWTNWDSSVDNQYNRLVNDISRGPSGTAYKNFEIMVTPTSAEDQARVAAIFNEQTHPELRQGVLYLDPNSYEAKAFFQLDGQGKPILNEYGNFQKAAFIEVAHHQPDGSRTILATSQGTGSPLPPPPPPPAPPAPPTHELYHLSPPVATDYLPNEPVAAEPPPLIPIPFFPRLPLEPFRRRTQQPVPPTPEPGPTPARPGIPAQPVPTPVAPPIPGPEAPRPGPEPRARDINQELRSRREELNRIYEHPELTPEQQRRVDELNQEIANLESTHHLTQPEMSWEETREIHHIFEGINPQTIEEFSSPFFVDNPNRNFRLTPEQERQLAITTPFFINVHFTPDGQINGRTNREAIPFVYSAVGTQQRFVNAERLTGEDSGLLALCAVAAENPQKQAELYLQVARNILQVHGNVEVLANWLEDQARLGGPQTSLFLFFLHDLASTQGTNLPLRNADQRLLIYQEGVNQVNINDLLNDGWRRALRDNREQSIAWREKVAELRQRLDEGNLERKHLRWIEFLSHSVDLPKLFEIIRQGQGYSISATPPSPTTPPPPTSYPAGTEPTRPRPPRRPKTPPLLPLPPAPPPTPDHPPKRPIVRPAIFPKASKDERVLRSSKEAERPALTPAQADTLLQTLPSEEDRSREQLKQAIREHYTQAGRVLTDEQLESAVSIFEQIMAGEKEKLPKATVHHTEDLTQTGREVIPVAFPPVTRAEQPTPLFSIEELLTEEEKQELNSIIQHLQALAHKDNKNDFYTELQEAMPMIGALLKLEERETGKIGDWESERYDKQLAPTDPLAGANLLYWIRFDDKPLLIRMLKQSGSPDMEAIAKELGQLEEYTTDYELEDRLQKTLDKEAGNTEAIYINLEEERREKEKLGQQFTDLFFAQSPPSLSTLREALIANYHSYNSLNRMVNSTSEPRVRYIQDLAEKAGVFIFPGQDYARLIDKDILNHPPVEARQLLAKQNLSREEIAQFLALHPLEDQSPPIDLEALLTEEEKQELNSIIHELPKNFIKYDLDDKLEEVSPRLDTLLHLQEDESAKTLLQEQEKGYRLQEANVIHSLYSLVSNPGHRKLVLKLLQEIDSSEVKAAAERISQIFKDIEDVVLDDTQGSKDRLIAVQELAEALRTAAGVNDLYSQWGNLLEKREYAKTEFNNLLNSPDPISQGAFRQAYADRNRASITSDQLLNQLFEQENNFIYDLADRAGVIVVPGIYMIHLIEKDILKDPEKARAELEGFGLTQEEADHFLASHQAAVQSDAQPAPADTPDTTERTSSASQRLEATSPAPEPQLTEEEKQELSAIIQGLPKERYQFNEKLEEIGPRLDTLLHLQEDESAKTWLQEQKEGYRLMETSITEILYKLVKNPGQRELILKLLQEIDSSEVKTAAERISQIIEDIENVVIDGTQGSEDRLIADRLIAVQKLKEALMTAAGVNDLDSELNNARREAGYTGKRLENLLNSPDPISLGAFRQAYADRNQAIITYQRLDNQILKQENIFIRNLADRAGLIVVPGKFHEYLIERETLKNPREAYTRLKKFGLTEEQADEYIAKFNAEHPS